MRCRVSPWRISTWRKPMRTRSTIDHLRGEVDSLQSRLVEVEAGLAVSRWRHQPAFQSFMRHLLREHVASVQLGLVALTGEAITIHGVKKSQAGMLVRSGTAAGQVSLETPAGITTISWPSAAVKATGAPPAA